MADHLREARRDDALASEIHRVLPQHRLIPLRAKSEDTLFLGHSMQTIFPPEADAKFEVEFFLSTRREIAQAIGYLADRERSQTLWHLLGHPRDLDSVPAHSRETLEFVLHETRHDLRSLCVRVLAAQGLIEPSRRRRR